MAILTTGFNVSQSGLTPDAVNISFSGQQLTVEAPAVSQGGQTVAASGTFDIVTSGASKTVFCYVINKSHSFLMLPVMLSNTIGVSKNCNVGSSP